MNNLLFGIILSAILSSTSFLVVLLRVSPLTAPMQAIPAFVISLFLSISSLATLLFYGIWRAYPIQSWDAGKLLSIALRQGFLFGLAMSVILGFHLLHLLNWWIAAMIIAVFLLVELAFEH